MCLEEMYSCDIPKGAIFYINAHRRIEIDFTMELRNKVRSTAKDLYQLLENERIPLAEYSAKCRKCSLYDKCLPKAKNSAKGYNMKLREAAIGGDIT